MARLPNLSPNVSAFLDMISFSEGTARYGKDDGYNVLVGGKLFTSYADHPDIVVDLGHGLKSTAAGRYQVLYRYWRVYKDQLDLPDFSPESQDRVALQLIRECHAMDYVEKGLIKEAIHLCKSRWASLPGAGYSQHENKLDVLLEAYHKARVKYAPAA